MREFRKQHEGRRIVEPPVLQKGHSDSCRKKEYFERQSNFHLKSILKVYEYTTNGVK